MERLLCIRDFKAKPQVLDIRRKHAVAAIGFIMVRVGPWGQLAEKTYSKINRSKKVKCSPGVVIHACNPALGARRQVDFYQVGASQDYRVRSYVKKTNKPTKQKRKKGTPFFNGLKFYWLSSVNILIWGWDVARSIDCLLSVYKALGSFPRTA